MGQPMTAQDPGATGGADVPLIYWGRCRTGRRWFWTAYEFGTRVRLEGRADTHEEAARQGHLAALELAGGGYAEIHVLHGTATTRLRELNAAKRQAKPAPKTTQAGPVEYLYFLYDGDWDGNGGQVEVWKYRIVKKTRTRIYYTLSPNPLDPSPPIGFVDRARIEAEGSLYHRGELLYLTPPELPQRPAPPDLKALKAAMRASHPDLGGSDAEFIAARAAYQRACTRAAATR